MLRIITQPAKYLRENSINVSAEILKSPEIQKFISEMAPTMNFYDGVGLAAPQVGKNLRICVISVEADKNILKKDLILINPAWEKLSRKTLMGEEGCLSVPHTFGKVKRFKDIQVTALDPAGNQVSFEAHNFFARVIQHEVDHLNGILFIDKARDVRVLSPKEMREIKKMTLENI